MIKYTEKLKKQGKKTNLLFCRMAKIMACNDCSHTVQKMKFSIKDFLSKCDQIHRKLRIWSHLLKKLLTENFIFCAVLEDEGSSEKGHSPRIFNYTYAEQNKQLYADVL